jgi:hypothetical protein
MTEAEWLWAATPAEILDRLPTATSRKRRLFCVACCWQVLTVYPDPIISAALTSAEQYADGWERREVVSSAAGQLWFAHSPARIADAVRALCRFGTDFDHNIVLSCLSSLHEQDRPDDIAEHAARQALLPELFGNPFRPVTFSPSWRTDTAITLASQMYESREFSAMPILADALQDAGCDNTDILNHCRDANQVHVRGCWVVDLVLGKQ